VRADRLVAILLMLQTRGRITAAEVADELEISERTARRDLDALGVAGLPVYSLQGRGGGWELAGGGRTDLSGLTSSEARALFLVAGPASSATPEIKAALRKLVRALPETFRDEAEAASAAVVVDPTAWDGTGAQRPPPLLLDAVQQAVIGRQRVMLGYRDARGNETTRVVHPLGLAAKGPTWYLVADTDAGQRTFRIDRMTSVVPTGEEAVRPAGFDLAEAWERIMGDVDDLRLTLRASVRVDADSVGLLRMMFGTRMQLAAALDGDDADRVQIEVRGHNTDALAGELAGLGDRIEVDGPPEIRARLAQIGAELVERYG
jgi:predicted DNA-binding transcriptional regulator YafY